MFTADFDIQNKLTGLAGAPFGHHARILAELAGRARPKSVLYIADDDMAAATTAQLLAFFSPHTEVISFPAWDCLPYDRVGPGSAIVAQRAEALERMLLPAKGQRIIITTAQAVLQKVPGPSAFKDETFILQTGAALDLEKLKAFLARNGYARVETVREAGEFAIRGSLIDIYPVGAEHPSRLDLFGDDIEAIRHFNPGSQRTIEQTSSIILKPVSEIMLDEATIARFRSGYRQQLGVGTGDPLYESVSNGRKYPGMEHWLPLFYDHLEPLTTYLPEVLIVEDQQLPEALATRHGQIEDFYAVRVSLMKADKKNGAPVYKPLPPSSLYLGKEEWAAILQGFSRAQLSPFPKAEGQQAVDCRGVRAADFSSVRAREGSNLFDAVRENLQKELKERRVLLACYSKGSAERLQHVLAEHNMPGVQLIETWEDAPKKGESRVVMGLLPLEHGFAAPDLLVLSEQDILGDRLSRPKTRSGRSDHFTLELSQLSEGDLVVHDEHGIGRYSGLETLEITGAPHDCLKVVYDGGDKLFVPVENMDVLSRYGSGSESAALDRLGSAAWQGRRARVKKRLKDMAEALLKIAAERQLQEGERIIPPEGYYQEFAARFPYAETDDQERAILNVFEDIASGKPMDRLVCGDVGFGKTEVAIRAAFAAVQAGLQVAVVVPTTLLARQHTRSFLARFHGYPVRIAQLSRMVTLKESKETKLLITDGKMDIVIGTHALLGKEVKFKNLGLLVVDEEQHFGVKQKERLKELRANVHVLTLTATPIPRTLQLALTGVRELSLITTPPVDRLAVRTFVLPYDPMIIREALMREHYRGGQSFYVCPRIEDLGALREQLQELVPELKIVTAHGRLGATELDDVMTAFDEAKYDVLLATNIVESGLDIPNANTIIMHRADMFGLSQLYQLRGRVGRAKQRGYAYLTYDPVMPLSATAQQRLEVLSTLEGLGAGFQLASHDLDIRGAGNLLGEEQSGHIREVGIELYQQMLEDAVAEARVGAKQAANQDNNWTPQINLGMPVLIPEVYVTDLGLRLNLYRRLADLQSREDIESFAAELIDRFGPLPPEVQNLLDTVYIKQLCRRSGVERLDAGPKGALVAFRNNHFAKPEKLIGYIQKNSGTIKVRPDQKLSCLRVWDDSRARLKGVEKILSELAELAA
jgi:transcription-repair coupling factor (superfamily II helicase)